MLKGFRISPYETPTLAAPAPPTTAHPARCAACCRREASLRGAGPSKAPSSRAATADCCLAAPTESSRSHRPSATRQSGRRAWRAHSWGPCWPAAAPPAAHSAWLPAARS
eukprot:scaffold23058_cov68-Phaeocystis_antarctica.AAC.11